MLGPAGSLNCPRQPFDVEGFCRFVASRQLRLLPAGTTSCRRGSRTHRVNHTFPGRTPEAQAKDDAPPSLALQACVRPRVRSARSADVWLDLFEFVTARCVMPPV